MSEQKVPCRTPNPDRPGITNIAAWKFDAIRAAILAILSDEGDVRWSELTEKVRERLDKDDLENLGSVGWYTVTVKLEMEVRGEVIRLPGKGPQTIRKA